MLLQALCITSQPYVHEFILQLQSRNALFGSKSTILLCRVTLKLDGWHWKTIGHLFYATSSFVHHFITICEFKLELWSGMPNWVLTSVTLTFHLWPWPFAWTSLLSMVITGENFMMIRWQENFQKVWQTDGRTDWTTHRAAWLQLKILQHLLGANEWTHWPYEAIWWYRSGSTMAQVMACCQYWFIILGSFVAFTWEQFHNIYI